MLLILRPHVEGGGSPARHPHLTVHLYHQLSTLHLKWCKIQRKYIIPEDPFTAVRFVFGTFSATRDLLRNLLNLERLTVELAEKEKHVHDLHEASHMSVWTKASQSLTESNIRPAVSTRTLSPLITEGLHRLLSLTSSSSMSQPVQDNRGHSKPRWPR